VRSDVDRKRLFGMAAQDRPAADHIPRLYGAEATARTYARLAELAATLLRAGLHTIVDAAFLRRRERDAMRPLADDSGAHLTLIECHAPEAVLRERVARRTVANRDASDADLAVLEHQLHTREPPAEQEQPQRLATDTDLDALRSRALAALGIA
jgi:predicted kinase